MGFMIGNPKMLIKDTDLGIEIYEYRGQAIYPKESYDPVIESVLLSPSDSTYNCTYCDIISE